MKQVIKQIDRPTALQPPNPPYSPWSDDRSDDRSDDADVTSREQQIRFKALLLTSALLTLLLTSLPQIGSWFKAVPPQSQYQQMQGPIQTASAVASRSESGATVVIQVGQPESATSVTLQLAPARRALTGDTPNPSLRVSREADQSTTIVVHPAEGQALNVVIQMQAK